MLSFMTLFEKFCIFTAVKYFPSGKTHNLVLMSVLSVKRVELVPSALKLL